MRILLFTGKNAVPRRKTYGPAERIARSAGAVPARCPPGTCGEVGERTGEGVLESLARARVQKVTGAEMATAPGVPSL